MTTRNRPPLRVEIPPALQAMNRRTRDKMEAAARALEARVVTTLTAVFVRQLRGIVAIYDSPDLGPDMAREELGEIIIALSGVRPAGP